MSHLTQRSDTELKVKPNKPQLSIESYHKLHRAQGVAFNMSLLIPQQEVNAAPLLWLHHIFSYISEDIQDIRQELKEKGLCDDYLKHSS